MFFAPADHFGQYMSPLERAGERYVTFYTLLNYSFQVTTAKNNNSPARRPASAQRLFSLLLTYPAGREAMSHTDLLPAGLITSSLHLTRILPGVKYISY
jgi:hypothetical protein